MTARLPILAALALALAFGATLDVTAPGSCSVAQEARP